MPDIPKICMSYITFKFNNLLIEQYILYSLPEESLSKTIVNIGKLIFKFLRLHSTLRLILRLKHANHLCRTSILHVFLNSEHHRSVGEHNDGKTNHLSDLGPHVADTNDLANQQE